MEFNLYKILSNFRIDPVTGSAFSQARYKIKHEYFRDLTKELEWGYEHANKRLWKGHLLIAGDGSTLNLPPSKDMEDHFGVYAIFEQITIMFIWFLPGSIKMAIKWMIGMKRSGHEKPNKNSSSKILKWRQRMHLIKQ